MTHAISGLDRLHAAMAARIDRGELPGMVILIAEDDHVRVDALGAKAFDSPEPMRRDTLFDCVRYFMVTAAKALGMPEVNPSDITALTTSIGTGGVQVDGKGTLEESYTQVKNALQTIPADRHILLYSINDDSVLGGWRAITESQREANTIVAGLGGSIAALKELRSNPQ